MSLSLRLFFRIWPKCLSWSRIQGLFLCSHRFIFAVSRFIESGWSFTIWIAGFIFCIFRTFSWELSTLSDQLFRSLIFEVLQFTVWEFRWCHFYLKVVVVWRPDWFGDLRFCFKVLGTFDGIWHGISFKRLGRSEFL